MAKSIYEGLRDEIVSGEHRPGEPLRENKLAEHFGTSRTPVREALRRLEQDGFVEHGARGMYVRVSNPEEILEIYEVRIVLEAAAARGAAEVRTDLDLVRLQQVHESMSRMPTDAPDRLADINRRFHRCVWQASHNGTLVNMLQRLDVPLERYRGTTLARGDRWRQVLREHAILLTAIRDSDSSHASDVAQAHMTRARDNRLQMYAESVETRI